MHRAPVTACFSFGVAWLALAIHFAGADVSLPLDGYCKPGKYFPVQLTGSEPASPKTFEATGCLSTEFVASPSSTAILPILAIGNPQQLHWPGGSASLRTPGEHERLIACVNGQIDPAWPLFPGEKLIPIRLDAANLLPGRPAVWEALDAIVLPSEQFARLTDEQRSAFLAGGLQLISLGENAPDSRWPWRQAGPVWKLTADNDGPLGEIVDEHMFSPISEWTPGWSSTVRLRVVAAATLIVLLMVAAMLLPRRLVLPAVLALSLGSTTGVSLWRQSLGTMDRAGGDIMIAGNGLIQRDSIVYERARATATALVPWTGSTHPVAASQTSLASSNLRLHVDANGQFAFEYHTLPSRTMAFIHRKILPGFMPAFTATSQSPMQDAARTEYLRPGTTIVGEFGPLPGRWPTVVLKTDKPSTSESSPLR